LHEEEAFFCGADRGGIVVVLKQAEHRQTERCQSGLPPSAFGFFIIEATTWMVRQAVLAEF
jgi:hypothetical protein